MRVAEHNAVSNDQAPIVAHRYELMEELSNSFISTRYLAVDTANQAALRSLTVVVSLFLLNAEAASDEYADEDLAEQAQAAARVIHPNVLRIFDPMRDGELAGVTAEPLRGPTLAERVTSPRMRPDAVVAVLYSLARALAALHEEEIYLGGVTATEIYLEQSGDLKLNPLPLFHGCPPSMAGEDGTLKNLDLISFGQVGLGLINRPVGKERGRAFSRFLTLVSPGRVPAELYTVIERAMGDGRTSGYSSIRELIDDLRPIEQKFAAKREPKNPDPLLKDAIREVVASRPQSNKSSLFIIFLTAYLASMLVIMSVFGATFRNFLH